MIEWEYIKERDIFLVKIYENRYGNCINQFHIKRDDVDRMSKFAQDIADELI